MPYWQTNRYFLRSLKIIAWIVAVLFVFLYLLPLLLFRIPAVQREVAAQTSHLLEEVFDTPVSLQRVDLVGWTNIEVHRVLVKDTADRPMLQADRLVGGLSLWDLLWDQELRITSARLFRAQLNLIRDPRTGRLNIQHTIDHLSRPSDSQRSLPVDINSIIIRDMRLSLHGVGKKPLQLTDLSTRIRRLRFASGYIGGAVDELSFSSNFGLTLSSLTTQLELKRSLLVLTNLQLALPHTSLSLPLARLDLQAKGPALVQEAELGASELSLHDLAFLYPALRSQTSPLHLQASYCLEGSREGKLLLTARQGEKLYLDGEVRLSWDSLGAIQRLQSPSLELAASKDLLERTYGLLPTAVQPYLQTLGKVTYTGKVDYKLRDHLIASGKLTTALGGWDYDLEARMSGERIVQIKAEASTQDFDPSPWLKGQGIPLERLALDLNLDLQNPTGKLEDWTGTASVNLPWFFYQGTKRTGLSVDLTPAGLHRHQIALRVDDPGLRLQVQSQATLLGKTPQDISLDFQLQHLDGTQWPLLPQLAHHRLSLGGHLTLSTLDLERAAGELLLDYAYLESPERILQLEQVLLRLSGTPEGERVLALRSPYVTTQLRGHYHLAQLIPDLKRTLYHHFPALAPVPYHASGAGEVSSSWDLALQLHRLPKEWQELLRLPLGLEQGVDLRVSYTGSSHLLHLEADAPHLRLQGNQLHDVHVALSDGELRLRGDLELASGTVVKDIALHTLLATDSLQAQVELGRDSLDRSNGVLNFGGHLERLLTEQGKDKGLGVSVTLSPSEVRVQDDRWQIAPARLRYAGGELHVAGLDLASSERRVSVSGALTSRPEDHLNVALKKINLRYILSAIGVGFDLVDTELTGQAQARLTAGKILATAAVTSPSFFVKGVDAGALRANLNFDSEDGRILLEAQVDQAQGGHADVAGYIRPANGAGIDLHFDADSLQAAFVAPFMNTLFDRVEGRATGQVRLFGIFEQGVTVEGTADVVDGLIGVRLLGTRYHFAHRLTFDPTAIHFAQVPVADDEGHRGMLNGVIRHRFFDEFDLDLTASGLRQMKVLETTTKQTLPFFGKAYGTGVAKLRGKLPKLLFDVDLTSDAGTDLTLDFNATDVRKEDRLFSFKSLHTESIDSIPASTGGAAPSEEDEETELTMRLALKVTPEARLALRMGSQSMPNEVVARCEGNLLIDVPHFGSPTTYGTLHLREGSYVFSFEELTRKRFTLQEGGRLDFRGDPLAALIDLKATHALTANIADLDAGLSTMAQRTTIPVNATIQLGGVISKPDITLGVELSGAEPELERRVLSLLSTQDERNRQFLYLMALGKFYTPENRRNTVQVSNSLTSFAASTLSDQLNRILGSFSRSVQFGTNFRTNNTAFEDTDIELLFTSSWLGDRLLINGNVGYHDNPFLAGKYLGEFDLEYKLNASGTLRLKGYSHYNNMYQYLRQSLTTQGLGFMFQRRFDSLQELFSPGRKRKKSTFATENTSN